MASATRTPKSRQHQGRPASHSCRTAEAGRATRTGMRRRGVGSGHPVPTWRQKQPSMSRTPASCAVVLHHEDKSQRRSVSSDAGEATHGRRQPAAPSQEVFLDHGHVKCCCSTTATRSTSGRRTDQRETTPPGGAGRAGEIRARRRWRSGRPCREARKAARSAALFIYSIHRRATLRRLLAMAALVRADAGRCSGAAQEADGGEPIDGRRQRREASDAAASEAELHAGFETLAVMRPEHSTGVCEFRLNRRGAVQ